MIKKYNIIKIFLILIVLVLLGTSKCYAGLQSVSTASSTYNLNDWIINIRKMETTGGVMGFNETLNADLTPKTSNGVDVHMQKNTEFGALAILSASNYGNPNKVTDGQTTTGNVSGVVMKINAEWVAAGAAAWAGNFKNAKVRYKNALTSTYVKMNGDAVSETAGWHGSGVSSWIQDAYVEAYGISNTDGHWYNIAGLVRSMNGSIFSYDGRGAYGIIAQGPVYAWRGTGAYTNGYRSRAVIVQGEGF